MKKIMLVVSSLGPGGAERVASILVNEWVSLGHEVTLVMTYSQDPQVFYRIDSKVEIIALRSTGAIKKILVLSLINRFYNFRRVITKKRPDLIVSFLCQVNLATILASIGTGIPVIASEHINPVVDHNASWIVKWLRKKLYPKAKIITVLTEDVVVPFLNQIPRIKRIAVLPNPIPPNLYDCAHVPIEMRSHVICAVGRLCRQKRFDVLITVFAKIAYRHPTWELHIWGDGELKGELTTQIKKIGMGKRIQLMGTSSNVWNHMGKSSIFALTSDFEGFPMVLLESMALGIPTVAFDCPSGPRDILTDKTIWGLVPHNDICQFADKLEFLMENTNFRTELSNVSKELVKSKYSLSTIIRLWDDAFKEAET